MDETAIVELAGFVFLKTWIASTEINVSTHGPQLSLLDKKASLREVVEFSEEIVVLTLSQQILLENSTATWPSSALHSTVTCILLTTSATPMRTINHDLYSFICFNFIAINDTFAGLSSPEKSYTSSILTKIH